MICIIRKKINDCLCNSSGVTLIELLVVIAIMGVALAPASTALLLGFNIFATEDDNMQRVYDAQSTLDHITDILRVNGDLPVSVSKYPADTALSNNALSVDNIIIYYNDSNKTVNKIENGTERTLLSNVASFGFDEIKKVDDLIYRFDIFIVLERREYSNKTFKTTIYLRNK